MDQMKLIINEEAGNRLDKFLAERGELTRSASQKLIEKGFVTVNGESACKNYILKINDIVDIIFPELEPLKAESENIPIDIVYEDDSLIVVNKPKGMTVHPAAGNYSGTLVNALLYHCKSTLSGINGVIRPGIVHRIDKDTSGLLVVAKNDFAHIKLAEQIKNHSLDRKYHAVVTGNIKVSEGVVDKPIGRHPNDRKKMAVVSNGRNAVTNYKLIENFDNKFSYIELKLETGRTHQIRVHMAALGHHVLGDTVYGTGVSNKFEAQNADILNGQCLHAKTLGIIHPLSGEYMVFDSELPEYFNIILDKLRRICDKQ